MIDKELHKNTQYRIPQLKEQFYKVEQEIATYILLEKNWDSYDAEAITLKTIKHSIKVSNEIYLWFENNIGFLNNRAFDIEVTPNCNGAIHIDITYSCYELDVYIKNNIELGFAPRYRHDINGKYTIADRKTGLIHSKDIIHKKFHSLKNIPKFLNEAFYKHKWNF